MYFVTPMILPLINLPKKTTPEEILICGILFNLINNPYEILILPTKWSAFYRSFLMLIVSLGIPYTASISTAYIMYASVYMVSLVCLPVKLFFCKDNHLSNYFPHNFSICYDAPLVLHISIFKYN